MCMLVTAGVWKLLHEPLWTWPPGSVMVLIGLAEVGCMPSPGSSQPGEPTSQSLH